MKKFFFALGALALLTACTGDGNDSSTNGSLTVNGETSTLKRGYIVPPVSNNPDSDPRRFLIILTDGKINITAEDGTLSQNTHHIISLNLNTDITHSGSVQNTTYPVWTLSGTVDQDGAFSEVFVDDNLVVDEDGDIDSSDEYSSDTMEEGQVTIEKEGNTYHITLTMHNGSTDISATYDGPLSQINLN